MLRRPLIAWAATLALACAGASRPAAPSHEAAPAAAHVDRSQAPENAPPPALQVPPQRHFQLTSGLKVRLVEYHRLPIVALHLVVDAGAVHDPAERPGLAGFAAAMLTEGTRRRSSTQISDEVGFLGASLSAGASFDAASLSASALSRHLEALLDLFADVLTEPAFPESDFARVQDERYLGLVQQRKVPGAIAGQAFAPLFWGKHPYGHWLLGTEQSVKATRREDLARFHREHWVPAASELVVVGDVREAELKAVLEKALGGWRAPGSVQAIVAAQEPAGRRTILIEKPGAPQAFLMMGMPGLERSSADYVPAEVAFQILGGGSASRLFRDLREKHGYTYGIYSREEARKLGGTSFIVGSVRADATGAALKDLLADVEQLRTVPVTPGELADAKNALVLGLPAEFATAADIASKLGEEVTYGLPDDYWDRFAAAVGRVTAADVQRVSARYLDPERLTTVMVGEAATVRPQLDGLPLGTVQVRPGPSPSSGAAEVIGGSSGPSR